MAIYVPPRSNLNHLVKFTNYRCLKCIESKPLLSKRFTQRKIFDPFPTYPFRSLHVAAMLALAILDLFNNSNLFKFICTSHTLRG